MQTETRRRLALTCNTNEARLYFALKGLGIAYMSEFSVRDALEAGTLVTVLDESRIPSGCYGLLCGVRRGR
jgi:DNA-binding transcriptional LysR family regulator